MTFEVQTRRDNGQLEFFPSLEAALRDAEDPTVWKISFPIANGTRVRLVREVGSPQFVLALLPIV